MVPARLLEGWFRRWRNLQPCRRRDWLRWLLVTWQREVTGGGAAVWPRVDLPRGAAGHRPPLHVRDALCRGAEAAVVVRAQVHARWLVAERGVRCTCAVEGGVRGGE